MEIRAGTGGEEAALFAGDLFRMYSRFCETKGWKVSVMHSNQTSLDGYKEIVFTVIGEGAYGTFRFESGGVNRRVFGVGRVHHRRRRRRHPHKLHAAPHLRRRISRDVKNRSAADRKNDVIPSDLRGQHLGDNLQGALQVVRLDLFAPADHHRTSRKTDPVLLHVPPDLRAEALRALHDVHVRDDQDLRLVRASDLLQCLRKDVRLPERILRELNGVTEATLLHVS